MFEELIDWPITTDRLRWQGRYVLKDIDREVHVFFRLTITGTHFVERGAEAFVRIGRVRSRFVSIASDGLTATAYFDQPPADEGIVEFGYAHTVLLRCARRFDSREVWLLRRALLPGNVRNLDRFAAMMV